MMHRNHLNSSANSNNPNFFEGFKGTGLFAETPMLSIGNLPSGLDVDVLGRLNQEAFLFFQLGNNALEEFKQGRYNNSYELLQRQQSLHRKSIFIQNNVLPYSIWRHMELVSLTVALTSHQGNMPGLLERIKEIIDTVEAIVGDRVKSIISNRNRYAFDEAQRVELMRDLKFLTALYFLYTGSTQGVYRRAQELCSNYHQAYELLKWRELNFNFVLRCFTHCMFNSLYLYKSQGGDDKCFLSYKITNIGAEDIHLLSIRFRGQILSFDQVLDGRVTQTSPLNTDSYSIDSEEVSIRSIEGLLSDIEKKEEAEKSSALQDALSVEAFHKRFEALMREGYRGLESPVSPALEAFAQGNGLRGSGARCPSLESLIDGIGIENERGAFGFTMQRLYSPLAGVSLQSPTVSTMPAHDMTQSSSGENLLAKVIRRPH